MLSYAVEMAAFAAFVTAAWLLSPIAGLAVLGVVLWVVAQGLDGVKVPVPKVKIPQVEVKTPKVRIPRPRPIGARQARDS